MSTIDAAIKFMTMEDKVLAFRDKRVLKELDKFEFLYDEACKRVSKDMFPYYRLLCPDDQNSNNANFQTLYTCAIAWAKDRNQMRDDFTFTATTSPKLVALAIEVDEKLEEIYTEVPEKEGELTRKEHITKIRKALGIDPEKILKQEHPPEPKPDSIETAKAMRPRMRGRPIQLAAVSQVVSNNAILMPQGSVTFTAEQMAMSDTDDDEPPEKIRKVSDDDGAGGDAKVGVKSEKPAKIKLTDP
ncbi:hypothetical protein QAD02_022097 [Eretmocerus hayati]|uniref:Uncharacterized protein n=1 Tax=Eretmocerus hayati TaxID=131215 RepID=A0ACC2PS46_9HYME|nr:hypothetical protein QAD02_022097 [Eretmocerus hayati]